MAELGQKMLFSRPQRLYFSPTRKKCFFLLDNTHKNVNGADYSLQRFYVTGALRNNEGKLK
jgi:hypothetical protein